MRIAFVAEDRAIYGRGMSEEDTAELRDIETIQKCVDAIASLGHDVVFINGIRELARLLVLYDPLLPPSAEPASDKDTGADDGATNIKDESRHQPDEKAISDDSERVGLEKNKLLYHLVVLDSAGIKGIAREAQVPALLEAYDIPFTHSDAATFATCMDKCLTKIVLDYHGIPTAPWVAVPNPQRLPGMAPPPPDRAQQAIRASCHRKALEIFPLFIKPSCEGMSKGIHDGAKVENAESLERTVAELCDKYPTQDILVESFLGGREITLGLEGTGEGSAVIGPWESKWKQDGLDYNDYEKKSVEGQRLLDLNDESCPDLSEKQVQEAYEVALKAWKVLKCRDMGRVDVRFDKLGDNAVANVIEINPKAGLKPGFSFLPLCAEARNLDLAGLMEILICHACARYGLDPKTGHSLEPRNR